MRLINADKLRKEIHMSYSDDLGIREVIDEQPTAYDVDKVIEKLEERKKYLLKDFVLADKVEEVKERTMARINEIDWLIEIVNSGGVADE